MNNYNKYIVTYPNESISLSETNIIFSEKLTHDEAWALINKLMHEFTLSTFDDDSIKPNDFVHFKDGQEKEFIKNCSKIRGWWSCLAIYDLSNDDDLNKLKDLGHVV